MQTVVVHRGTVSPVRTSRNPAGDYCREFEQTATIGGQPQRSYGTACCQPADCPASASAT